MPRICWHTIFICRKPQWYGKPLKQRGLLSRQANIRRGTGASRIVFFAQTNAPVQELKGLPEALHLYSVVQVR